jgi:hypothetical protein
LACGRCNGSENKGDLFPDTNSGGPFVDPCTDEPSSHFSFSYDKIAGNATVYGKTTRGETTEQIIGLNRPDLLKHRSKFVQKLICLAEFSRQGDPQAQALINQASAATEEYAAFSRALQSGLIIF